MHELHYALDFPDDEHLETTANFGQLSVKLAAITLAATAVLMPQELAHDDRPTVLVAGVEVPQYTLPDSEHTTMCPAPVQPAIDAVKRLLQQPITKKEGERVFTDRSGLAKTMGVTVQKPSADFNRLVYFTVGRESPFTDYFKTAQQMFKTQGVTLRFATQSDFDTTQKNWKAHIPTFGELENPIAKSNMIYMMNTLFTAPKEYFALSGLTEMVIAKDFNAAADASGSRIRFDLGQKFDGPSGIVNHEIGHLVQGKLCGNAVDNDPTYTNLNKGIPYTGGNQQADVRAYNAIDERHAQNDDLVRHSFTTEDYASAEALAKAWDDRCPVYKKYAANDKDIVFTDAYGATNKAEDEAQVLGQLTQGWEQDLFHPEFPVLNQKGVIELARLLQYGQIRTVQYLVKVMRAVGTINDDRSVPLACTKTGADRHAYLAEVVADVHDAATNGHGKGG